MGENRRLPEADINSSVNAAPSGIRTQNFYEHPAEAAAANTREENQGQAENSTGRNQGQAASSTSRRLARDTR